MKTNLEVILEFIPKLFWPIIIASLIFYIIKSTKKNDHFKKLFIELIKMLKTTKSFNAGPVSFEFQESMRTVSSELAKTESKDGDSDLKDNKTNATKSMSQEKKSSAHQDVINKSSTTSNSDAYTIEMLNKYLINSERSELIILDSWLSVEKNILRFYPLMAPDSPKIQPIRIIMKLMDESFLPRSAFNIYRELSSTRNNVVHAPQEFISFEDSITYKHNCELFIKMLDNAYQNFILLNPQPTQ